MTVKQNLIGRLAIATDNAISAMKGKKRDEAAILLFIGAQLAAEELGHKDDAQWIGRVTSLVLATRGYEELHRMAEKARAGNMPENPDLPGL